MDTRIVITLIAIPVGIVSAIFGYWWSGWRKSKEGSWVTFTHTSQSSAFTMTEKTRKLEVLYDQRPVEKLAFSTLRVVNDGIEDITDAINVELQAKALSSNGEASPKGGFFATIEKVDPLNLVGKIDEHLTEDTLSAKIVLSHLNRFSAHETEEVEFAIFSNADVEIMVSGSGKGWTTKFISLQDWQVTRISPAALSAMIALIGLYLGLAINTVLNSPTPQDAAIQIGWASGLIIGIALLSIGIAKMFELFSNKPH